MGLDIYVGSLTRYYTGQWETVAERLSGAKPPVEPEDKDLAEPAQVEELITAWMRSVGQGVATHLSPGVVFSWRDDLSSPYFTDRPPWGCYGSLLLWAAYAERPHLTRPQEFVAQWDEDPAYQDSQSRTRFGQLLGAQELWLPVELKFTFRSLDPAGREVGMGSVHQLLHQLMDLNDMTWQADPDEISRWRSQGAEHTAPLEAGAKYAFAVLFELSQQAVRYSLPLKLDY